jgi:hypothetical protein
MISIEPTTPALAELRIRQVRRDGGTQLRAEMDWADIERMAAKADRLPPAIVFFDGKHYWLADGFQRVEAWQMAGRRTFYAQVLEGTQRDARRYALRANADHGRQRTPEDLKRVFEAVTEDPEWSQLTNVAIAEMVGVSEWTVRKYLPASSRPSTMRTVQRGETTYTMDVAQMTRERFDSLPEAARLKIIQEEEAKAAAARGAELAQEQEQETRADARAKKPAKTVFVRLELATARIAAIDAAAARARCTREAMITRALAKAFPAGKARA